MKFRQKSINMQNATRINDLTCDRESDQQMRFMHNLCRKVINNHVGQSRMQSRARVSNITYTILPSLNYQIILEQLFTDRKMKLNINWRKRK